MFANWNNMEKIEQCQIKGLRWNGVDKLNICQMAGDGHAENHAIGQEGKEQSMHYARDDQRSQEQKTKGNTEKRGQNMTRLYQNIEYIDE